MNNNINNNYNPFATTGAVSHSVPTSFAGANPFGSAAPPNPFQAQQAPKPSMNQMRTQVMGVSPQTVAPPGTWGHPHNLVPNNPQEENPFLV